VLRRPAIKGPKVRKLRRLGWRRPPKQRGHRQLIGTGDLLEPCETRPNLFCLERLQIVRRYPNGIRGLLHGQATGTSVPKRVPGRLLVFPPYLPLAIQHNLNAISHPSGKEVRGSPPSQIGLAGGRQSHNPVKINVGSRWAATLASGHARHCVVSTFEMASTRRIVFPRWSTDYLQMYGSRRGV